jgi:hypothetical protein
MHYLLSMIGRRLSLSKGYIQLSESRIGKGIGRWPPTLRPISKAFARRPESNDKIHGSNSLLTLTPYLVCYSKAANITTPKIVANIHTSSNHYYSNLCLYSSQYLY